MDAESLERANLAAVPPEAMEELHGWLLAFDRGTVGRAHSAVPLRHEAGAARADILPDIVRRYRAHGLQPVLRIPDLPCFEPLCAALHARGHAGSKRTLTQVAEVDAVLAAGDAAAVRLDDAPDAAWTTAFMGEGFDPADAASRIGILRRGRQSLFARVLAEGRVAAVGVGCYAQGWCGVHGMRTAPEFRRRGFAGAVLAALAREARSRGIARAFLQVEAERAQAQAVYRRAGFRTAWALDYWTAG